MPCSCGNTTCPCGIPCYCSEASCKCHACEIALRRFCKICNKSISGILTDKDTCSCFVRESTALILENPDNPQWRMGNVPTPVGYFMYGKLIVNVMAPVLSFPQFAPQRPISLISSPPLKANSRKILPPFFLDEDVVNPLYPTENSGSSTPEFHDMLETGSNQSISYASSGNCMAGASNSEISFKETCPSVFLQPSDERKTGNVEQHIETDKKGSVLELSSFYLPSIKIGTNSYPVALEDAVWRLPNPFSISGSPNSSLMLYNPFYVDGPAHTLRTVSTYEKECLQTALGLNYDSNGLAQAESYKTFQRNEQTFDPSKITEHLNLKIDGEHSEYDAKCSENVWIPFSFNSKGIPSTEQWGQNSVSNLPSNKIPANNLMSGQKLATVSNDISSSRVQGLLSVPSQPLCTVSSDMPSFGVQGLFGVQSQQERGVSTFGSEKSVCPQTFPTDYNGTKAFSPGEVWEKVNCYPDQINSGTHSMHNYLVPNKTSKLKWLFEEQNTQNSEENKYSQSGKKENDSIPFYLDTSTTQKMDELLKLAKQSNVGSPLN